MLPEALDLQEPAHCLVTPRGEFYAEAAIATAGGGGRRGSSG